MRALIVAAVVACAPLPSAAFELRMMVGSLCHPGLGHGEFPDVLITDRKIVRGEGLSCSVAGPWESDGAGGWTAPLDECWDGMDPADPGFARVDGTRATVRPVGDGSYEVVTDMFTATAWPCWTE